MAACTVLGYSDSGKLAILNGEYELMRFLILLHFGHCIIVKIKSSIKSCHSE